MQNPVLKASPYLLWSNATSFLYFSGIDLGDVLLLPFFTMTLGAALFSKRLETEGLRSAPNILFIKSVNIMITLFMFQILGNEAARIAFLRLGQKITH